MLNWKKFSSLPLFFHLNESLAEIDVSPIEKRKLERSQSYGKEKGMKICEVVSKSLQSHTQQDIFKHDRAGEDMLQQLKRKFRSCSTTSEKIQVLTVLPQSWNRKKVREEFRTTDYMVRKAKSLVAERGILTIPNPKVVPFPQGIVDHVTLFYKSEEISRMMPGKKDFFSVLKDGRKEHAQKHLILCN